MTALSACRLLLGIGLTANGLAMLLAPAIWYATIPGVTSTGPLNLHFVRDIGCAYLVAAGGFLWLARDPAKWPAAMAGTAFLALHASVHLAEFFGGHSHLSHLLTDLPGVFLVPLFALWLAWPRRFHSTAKENHHVAMDRAAPARRL